MDTASGGNDRVGLEMNEKNVHGMGAGELGTSEGHSIGELSTASKGQGQRPKAKGLQDNDRKDLSRSDYPLLMVESGQPEQQRRSAVLRWIEVICADRGLWTDVEVLMRRAHVNADETQIVDGRCRDMSYSCSHRKVTRNESARDRDDRSHMSKFTCSRASSEEKHAEPSETVSAA